MKTIKNSKDITTLELDDKVVFGNLQYIVTQSLDCGRYYLLLYNRTCNDAIFKVLNVNTQDFFADLGINADTTFAFPEVKSLEALTAVVSAIFKEYEKQNQLPTTWEEFCKRTKMGDKKFCLYDGVIIGTGVSKNKIKDSILIDSPEEAQAFRALMQLRQLHKAYVKDWEPDWCDHTNKYNILVEYNQIKIYNAVHCQCSLSFPTYILAEQFLNNFNDLLEVAKPLL